MKWGLYNYFKISFYGFLWLYRQDFEGQTGKWGWRSGGELLRDRSRSETNRSHDKTYCLHGLHRVGWATRTTRLFNNSSVTKKILGSVWGWYSPKHFALTERSQSRSQSRSRSKKNSWCSELAADWTSCDFLVKYKWGSTAEVFWGGKGVNYNTLWLFWILAPLSTFSR